MLKPLKRKSLSEEIIEAIQDLLKSGQLKPGDKLPTERDLAEQLCVSRASVREALRALSLSGVLVVKPSDGIYFNDKPSQLFSGVLSSKLLLIIWKDHALELAEARKVLEIELVKLAAERAKPENIEDLENSLSLMEEYLDDPDFFIKQDVAFHLAVSEAAQNVILFEAINAIRGIMTECQLAIAEYPGLRKRSLKYHKGIYEAVKEGDSIKAAGIMSEHLINVDEAIREYLSNLK